MGDWPPCRRVDPLARGRARCLPLRGCDQLANQPADQPADQPSAALRAAESPGASAPDVSDDSACWTDGIKPEVCCSTRFGASGLSECWSASFTYERCCASYSPPKRTEGDCFSELHISGYDGRAICCDTTRSNEGAKWCWHDGFTFDICCQSHIAGRCSMRHS